MTWSGSTYTFGGEGGRGGGEVTPGRGRDRGNIGDDSRGQRGGVGEGRRGALSVIKSSGSFISSCA